MHKQKYFPYHIPEFETELKDELKPHLTAEELSHVMSQDNKPNAIIALQSKH